MQFWVINLTGNSVVVYDNTSSSPVIGVAAPHSTYKFEETASGGCILSELDENETETANHTIDYGDGPLVFCADTYFDQTGGPYAQQPTEGHVLTAVLLSVALVAVALFGWRMGNKG